MLVFYTNRWEIFQSTTLLPVRFYILTKDARVLFIGIIAQEGNPLEPMLFAPPPQLKAVFNNMRPA